MMRRIDLLPASYAEQRRERRSLRLAILVGALVLLALFGYWFYLGMQISDAEDELAGIEQRNNQLEQQIAELQRFADLDAEVRAKEAALQTVMTGDIDWPAILTEIAMVIPGEVWLDQLATSAGATEGASQVGTETAAVDVSPQIAVGRIAFSGQSLSFPGVAKWLIRLQSVREFTAVWLNSASGDEATEGTQQVFTFDSTLELGERSLSGRFQGAQP